VSKILKKKENLKEGEIIPVFYDSAFKIMYANEEHLEILTVLLSKVLNVDYKTLEGNVSLLPLQSTNKTVDEKKCEKDVRVSVKTDRDYNITIEVNIRAKKYQNIIDRNIYYMHKDSGHTLKEGMDYDDIPYTLLINFNNFFINHKRKLAIEEFIYRDDCGFQLTKKDRILNINIDECYRLWYNHEYEGKFKPYEEDLVLLCAAMMVDNEEKFHEIISMVEMKPEIKVLMEGLVKQMSHDEELVTGYKTWKNEEERIQSSIIKEERRNSLNEGLAQGMAQKCKEMVLNMHNKNISLDIIAECANLTIEEVKEIIENKDNIN